MGRSKEKDIKAYFASMACRSCPTTSGTNAISTTEYGLTIRNRFVQAAWQQDVSG
jgi:hypothetical protein